MYSRRSRKSKRRDRRKRRGNNSIFFRNIIGILLFLIISFTFINNSFDGDSFLKLICLIFSVIFFVMEFRNYSYYSHFNKINNKKNKISFKPEIKQSESKLEVSNEETQEKQKYHEDNEIDKSINNNLECTNCGTLNKANLSFCENCGKKIEIF